MAEKQGNDGLNGFKRMVETLDLPKDQKYEMIKFHLIKDPENAASIILPDCYSEEDFMVTSNAIQMIVAFDPKKAEKIFPLTFPAVSKTVTVSPAFVLGTILGYFRSADWLTRNFPIETTYKHVMLPGKIVDIIVSHGKLMELVDAFVDLPGSKFENRLSEAIKQFVHSDAALKHRNLKALVEELNVRSKARYSRLGELVINQLFHKFINCLYPYHLIGLMSSYFDPAEK